MLKRNVGEPDLATVKAREVLKLERAELVDNVVGDVVVHDVLSVAWQHPRGNWLRGIVCHRVRTGGGGHHSSAVRRRHVDHHELQLPHYPSYSQASARRHASAVVAS